MQTLRIVAQGVQSWRLVTDRGLQTGLEECVTELGGCGLQAALVLGDLLDWARRLAVDQDRLQVNPGNALRYEPQFRFGMREQ
jgi:hypothetical protein